ncbi:hypothetical protein D3C87_1614780 [compost metagenome]
MIQLMQQQIGDFTRFDGATLVLIAAQRGVKIELELVKGKIAELPAQMQQRLPHVQRQGHAFNLQIAFGQRGAHVAHFKLWAKSFPTALDEIDLYGHAGEAFNLCQQLRAIVVQFRQRQTQPADQQRHDDNQSGACS